MTSAFNQLQVVCKAVATDMYGNVKGDWRHTEAVIKAIQLDAYKAGLMKAQLLASPAIADWAQRTNAQSLSGLQFCVTDVIVTAADNATVADLAH